MPQVINISEEDIVEAEKILLPAGSTFDPEKRTFISNLETIDLQSVPGSGKTTVLLAKLLILEKKFPFENGSGILVISHTNAAIHEIKNKIQKYCPKLFSYPNFVGTIQSFVDEFLAIPYYQSKFKKKIVRIDNEIYSEILEKYISRNLPGFTRQEQKNARYFLFGTDSLYTYRLQLRNGIPTLVNSINGSEIRIAKPRRGRGYIDFTIAEKERIKEWLERFKFNVIKNTGILHFDDAYFLAETYLIRHPSIKQLLQKRFAYVFVDEMQDMDKHQYDLLEKIFYSNGNSISKYQRIGDKNQSVYNGEAKVDIYWTDRDIILPLNCSHRLSPSIADVVTNFALFRPTGFRIIGLGEVEIKPHLIVYSIDTIQNVIPTFFNIIRTLQANGQFPLEPKHPIKIIAWNSIWKTPEEKTNINNVRLSDYHTTFSREEHKLRVDYSNLKCYLKYYDKSLNCLESINKNILNALLKILRLEAVSDSEGRNFTRKHLIETIKNISNTRKDNTYESFKLNIYNWSIEISRGNTNDVLESISTYVPHLLEIFDKQVNNSQEFITGDDEINIYREEVIVSNNILKFDEIDVEVTTVHSVKGQTHSATLYLESSYFGQHETERLNHQFLGQAFDDNRVRHKESTKMAYVGLSRPTNLLCTAVHADRYNQFLNTINLQQWEVINITEG